MLVLTRKPQERIRIAENIEIVVLEIRGGRAKIGISCPVSIPIQREEIVGMSHQTGLAAARK